MSNYEQYVASLPEIAKNLERIADNLEKIATALERINIYGLSVRTQTEKEYREDIY